MTHYRVLKDIGVYVLVIAPLFLSIDLHSEFQIYSPMDTMCLCISIYYMDKFTKFESTNWFLDVEASVKNGNYH